MKYNTVFIDLDDTLIDTSGSSHHALKEVYEQHGIETHFSDFEKFSESYFYNNFSIWDQYHKGLISKDELNRRRFGGILGNLPGFTEDHINEINHFYTQRTISIAKPMEGALELVEYLHHQYKLIIVSNGFTEMQYKKIGYAGFDSTHFDHIVLSDQIDICKPDKRIFEYALKKSESIASECIMIGDNLSSDIEGGKRSGINQIWFNPGNYIPVDIVPTYTVTSLKEITHIL